SVERVTAAFDASHLENACLVFAATDSAKVNNSVVREAHRRGILVCRADVDETDPGDFTVPAVLRESEVTLTVSANGNPALATKIRDSFKDKLNPAHLKMSALLKKLRPAIRRTYPSDQAKRAAIFRDLASDEAMAILTQSGEAGLTHWLKTK